MTRTRVVIQSRLNSSRLPGKALLTIAGMPLIELVARRASRSGHEVVVATSQEHYDSRIADHLSRAGIDVVRGDLDDVLGRFLAATSDLSDVDTVVRLTGDNPVGDATLIDELAAAMSAGGYGYGRVDVAHVPEGLGCEVFSVKDLRSAGAHATDSYDREHVTPWLRRNIPTLDYVPVDNPGDPRRYRCTVDVLADYDRVCRVFADLTDPVAAPWPSIIRRLAQAEFTDGPSVPVRDRSELGQSAVVIGGDQLANSPAPRAEVIRAMLAAAVNRGVTHVDLLQDDGRAEGVLQQNADPQLTRRLSVICRLAPADANHDETVTQSVSAHLERSFASLGRRSMAAALFPSVTDAHAGSGAAWQRLLDYHAEGVVGRVGVTVTSPSELRDALALPELGYLEIPMSVVDPPWADLGADLSERDVVVTTYGGFGGGRLFAPDHPLATTLTRLAEQFGRTGIADLAIAFVLGHDFVTSMAVGADTLEQVRDNLEWATRPSLTLDQITQVRRAIEAART
ncbi:aldo/keto reductase [Demetria terragena]|uniref:aldo/keto reductase n=1 Tax=Demetria terragena TaxID=63959 RepID=UPI00036E05A5|nr:aldo/keto reductase [Demetria terragena]